MPHLGGGARTGPRAAHRNARDSQSTSRSFMSAADLRRTFACNMSRAGVSEGELMRLAGWRTRSMLTVTTSLTRPGSLPPWRRAPAN